MLPFAGTGCGMSPHVVLTSVWPCTTDPMLLLLSKAAICSSGVISNAAAKITSYANMQKVRYMLHRFYLLYHFSAFFWVCLDY